MKSEAASASARNFFYSKGDAWTNLVIWGAFSLGCVVGAVINTGNSALFAIFILTAVIFAIPAAFNVRRLLKTSPVLSLSSSGFYDARTGASTPWTDIRSVELVTTKKRSSGVIMQAGLKFQVADSKTFVAGISELDSDYRSVAETVLEFLRENGAK